MSIKPKRLAVTAGALYIIGVAVLFSRGAGILAAYLTLPASWLVIGILSEQFLPGSNVDVAFSSWTGNLVLLLISALLNVTGVYAEQGLIATARALAAQS